MHDIEVGFEQITEEDKQEALLIEFTDGSLVVNIHSSDIQLLMQSNSDEVNVVEVHAMMEELKTHMKIEFLQKAKAENLAKSISESYVKFTFDCQHSQLKNLALLAAVGKYNDCLNFIRNSNEGDYLYDVVLDLVDNFSIMESMANKNSNYGEH